jgi:hypothetical protein
MKTPAIGWPAAACAWAASNPPPDWARGLFMAHTPRGSKSSDVNEATSMRYAASGFARATKAVRAEDGPSLR